MKILKISIVTVAVLGLSIWTFATLSSNKEIIDEKASATEEVINQIPVKVFTVA